MITQADSDVRDRVDGVLLVREAVTGLDADAPPAGFGGFLADGCGGDDLVVLRKMWMLSRAGR